MIVLRMKKLGVSCARRGAGISTALRTCLLHHDWDTYWQGRNAA